MSIKVMSQLWEHSQNKGTALLMLLAIADNADERGYAWPGVDYLAEKTRMTRQNVILLIKKIEASGEVSIAKRQGPKGCNMYHIKTDWTQVPMPALQELAQVVNPSIQTTADKDDELVKPSMPPCKIQEGNPVMPSIQEPSLNRQESSISAGVKESPASVPESTTCTTTREETVETPKTGKVDSGKESIAEEKRQQKVVRDALADYFSDRTGIQKPAPSVKKGFSAAQKLWWTPLSEIGGKVGWNLDAGKKLIDETLEKLKDCMIVDPNSILKSARALADKKSYGRKKVHKTGTVTDPVTQITRSVEWDEWAK